MYFKAKSKSIVGYIRRAISKEFLKHHLSISLYRNSYSLVMAGIVTSALGLLFWVIAARLYSPEDVGLASATISAVILLSSIAYLGLGIGLIRFIPSAGERSISLINSSLTVAGLTSLVVSAIFIGGVGLWSPALSYLQERPIYAILFLVFTLVWTLSHLVDETFISKRAAHFTLIKNAISSVLKIILLLVPVFFMGAISIFLSAAMGMMVGVLISLLFFLPLIFKRYLPIPTLRRDLIRRIIPYSLGNYIGLLLWGLPAMIYPLIVVNALGAEATAYFYIAWAIASIVFMIPIAISFSVLAEGSYYEELLIPSIRKSLLLCTVILVPSILILCALGSKLLLLFGATYSQESLTLLIVLAFSSLPLMVNQFYITVNRVRKNIKMVAIVSGIIAFLCLSLGYILMLRFGITGVGIGFLAAQIIVAVTVFLPMIRQPKIHKVSYE